MSWVRIVNGIDEYVTETSETISIEHMEHRVMEKPVAKAEPRPMPTVTLSPIFILVRERNWTDINQEILSILQCQNSWSDYCDMILQFLERMMEQYDLTILRKKSRQSSMVLRNAN